MNNLLSQHILRQAEAHQLLLHECDLRLNGRTLTIVCHQRNDATAVKEAIPSLSEGLELIADHIVVRLGQCMVYRCTVKVALKKYSLRLTALHKQLKQVGILPR